MNALSTTLDRTATSDRTGRITTIAAVVLVAVGVAATIAFFTLASANGRPLPAGEVVLITTAFLAFIFVGGLVASRVPRNATGWLMLAVGTGTMVSNLIQQYASYGLETRPGSLPGALALAWLGNWSYYASLVSVLFVLQVFPTGRPISRAWRIIAWTDVAIVVLALSSLAFGPRALEGLDIPNPLALGVLAAPLGFIDRSAGWLLLFALATSVASPIARARRARGLERQQLKWLALGAVVFAVCFGVIAPITEVGLGVDISTLAWALGLVALPVTIGIGILGYRLYDLDLVVNRSLVYVILTAVFVALYAGLVAVLDAVLGRAGGAVIASASVALTFQPLRQRVQRGINRLMYGHRDEPYAVITRLAAELSSSVPAEQTLTSIAQTVTSALRLPYAAIELRDDNGYRVGGNSGEAGDIDLTLPLVHRDEEVGRLLVSARHPGAEFSSADLNLLDDLARQAGAAAYTVRLLTQLQRSREELVGALEEERRRIRRDLHDGLGPTLAAMSLELEAARNLVASDPDEAAALIATMASKTQGAIADVRRLVYGLRPPALDQLGLVAALSEAAGRFEGSDGLQVEVAERAPMSDLPAAVEVAAYRIAVEAITNVAKHAGARRCRVLLDRPGPLVIEVRDDGKGMGTTARPGVGLSSMRERAEVLGGTVKVTSAPEEGTIVRAVLPVGRS